MIVLLSIKINVSSSVNNILSDYVKELDLIDMAYLIGPC